MDDIALFWVAMQSASAGDLPGVLSEYSEVAFYNPARHAVQVRGCNGGIIAHVPLGDVKLVTG